MSISLSKLPKRRLGRTNLEVTSLSMGGAGFGRNEITDDQAIEAVHRAIELGINYLDTSPLYGESERRVGLALNGGWRRKSTSPLKQAHIPNGVVTIPLPGHAGQLKIACVY